MFAKNYIKRRFGTPDPKAAQEEFYSSLRVALHSTLTINTVDLILLSESMNQNVVMPVGPLSVLALSTLKEAQNADPNIALFRFYLQDSKRDEYILLLTENGGEPVEAMLYRETSVIEPQSVPEWDRYMSAIGFETQEFDKYTYARAWGSRYTEKAELTPFHERIVTPDSDETLKDSYLMYSREIEALTGDKVEEFLLLGVEEDDKTAKITFQVGYKIDLSNITVQ